MEDVCESVYLRSFSKNDWEIGSSRIILPYLT